MKKILLRIYRQLGILIQLGLRSYLDYRFSSKGKLLAISINNNDIWVRKGTPDLGVAISCLTGEFELLRYLFPKDYSGVIVDAGGYIGTATLALREMFPKAKIIIIEPSQENIKVLKKNLSSTNNVDVVYGALVGQELENIELKNRGTGEWGFTVVSNPKDKTNAQSLHKTPAFTLSKLGVDIADIGILKIDIEGGEYDLLNNDLSSLKEIKVVYAELHDRIIDGCSDLFLDYSKDRILIKDKGEKYLSIKA